MFTTILSITAAFVFAYLLIRQQRNTLKLYRENIYLTEVKNEAVKQNNLIAKLVMRYLRSTSFTQDEETLKEIDAWLEQYKTYLSDCHYIDKKYR